MFKKSTICLAQKQFQQLTFFNRCYASIITNVEPKQIHEESSCETKVLKVAIVGTPNAGKSTFINNIMDRKVCPTSSKVHTTKKKSLAIFTHLNSQIIFLDTPGVVSLKEQKRYNLEKSFLKDCKKLNEADIIGVIHDASNIWTQCKLDIKIIRLLEDFKNKPSFLVLNKVDLLKSKRKLLDITRAVTNNHLDGKPIPNVTQKSKHEDKDLKAWPNFKEIFMVSSLTGSGLEDIKDYLTKMAIPSPWLYPEDVFTNESAEDIITASVRGKLLDFLPQEMPYTLNPQIEFFEYDNKGAIKAVVIINCPSERIARFVAGCGDGKLRQITEHLQHDLQCTFKNFVRLKLVLSTPLNK